MRNTVKAYGKENKGFQKARVNNLERHIRNRRAKGERGYNSKKLAQMMDNLYGSDQVEYYHTGPDAKVNCERAETQAAERASKK